MKSYARLYPQLLERIQRTPAFASRDEAINWMRDAWVQIHKEAGASQRRIAIMQSARICPEQGWRDIDKDPCYLTSPETPPLRLYIHNDGTVVLQQICNQRNEIVYAKPGKVLVSAL